MDKNQKREKLKTPVRKFNYDSSALDRSQLSSNRVSRSRTPRNKSKKPSASPRQVKRACNQPAHPQRLIYRREDASSPRNFLRRKDRVCNN